MFLAFKIIVLLINLIQIERLAFITYNLQYQNEVLSKSIKHSKFKHDTLPKPIILKNNFPSLSNYKHKKRVDSTNIFPSKTPIAPSANRDSLSSVVKVDSLSTFDFQNELLTEQTNSLKVKDLIDSLITGHVVKTKDIFNRTNYLVIEGIEQYPRNQITIYSWWGEIIYSKSNYSNTNPWDFSYRENDLLYGSYMLVLECNNNFYINSLIIQN